MNYFEAVSNVIRPDADLAVIVLEERSEITNRHKAVAVLKSLNCQGYGIEIVKDSYPGILLIRINPDLMKEAVLKLTESGFNKLKAISPKMEAPQAIKT